MPQYYVTGLMSGTSLDGLDLAFCLFTEEKGNWKYEIKAAETFPYPDSFKEKIRSLETATAAEFALADAETGHFFGRIAKEFHQKHNIKPDFIASHGQTIFHQPDKRFTTQIGKGAAISAETGLPVVCDFRSLDVALGGQGAPLVPVGDQLLFHEYDFCLNLGGFANISLNKDGKRIAFDVCPANIVLNYLSEKAGKAYDNNGEMASSGKIIEDLLQKLNLLDFYDQNPPKSLGKEWVLKYVFPLLNEKFTTNDILRTFTENIAFQIARSAEYKEDSKMLVTGGGAFNKFLISRIKDLCKAEIIIPDENTIGFKEALIFAFLGVLRWRKENNCLSSVTGAKFDNCGGAVYYSNELF